MPTSSRLPRASGVLLHPTSLPGPHGSGDLGPAAYHFVDWLKSAGQTLWQTLPLGGIGPGNSPYMSSSAFAGNVLLIDLADLQRRGWLAADALTNAPSADPRRIDFATMVPWRMARLADAARAFAASTDAAERVDFSAFCQRQASWLDDYALFMAQCEATGWADWSTWPDGLAQRTPQAMAAARLRHADAIAFWQFCQWCFFRQWAALRAHAHAQGVQIIGDAPIFIAHQSAEVWARQDLFELDATGKPTVVAGVPPDYFSATGQRWGNPLYRWEAHAAEGYAWWIERVRRTLELVDIVRIDHFRGFAAHWEIPADAPTAVAGRWMPGPGAALFDAIRAALGPLPVIAEDLGVITDDVVALRHRFALPGMRILQFAFGGDAGNAYLPHNHEPDSVVYTGTHDNDTTLGWWAGAAEPVRRHVRRYLGRAADDAAGDVHVHLELIRLALASVADTAIVPMQDVLGLDGAHRMNVPGTIGPHNWTWRFDWQWIEADTTLHLAKITEDSGRGSARPPIDS